MIETDKYLDISFSEADCYELGSIIYEDIKGYPLPSFKYDLENINSMVEAVDSGDSVFTSVEREDLQELDGIVFASPTCGRHIGFYLGNNLFIHQVRFGYPAIESLKSPKWSKRIIEYCRYEQ